MQKVLKLLFASLLSATFAFADDKQNLDKELANLVQAEQKIVEADKTKVEAPLKDEGSEKATQAEISKLKNKLAKANSENQKLVKDFKRAVEGLKELKAVKEKALKESLVHQAEKEKLKEERGQLQQEIVQLQNELLLRETEIKVLSGEPAAKKELEKMRLEQSKVTKEAAPIKNEEVVSDITIVEVIADKVNIRSGAGTEHSPIMQVQRGTRLTVEAREGAWYRVFTPTGSRGYIQVNVVRQAQVKTPAKKVASVNESKEDMVPFDDAGSAKDQSSERKALDRLRSNFIKTTQ